MRYKQYIQKECERCKVSFEVPPRNKGRRFCSIKCSNAKGKWLGKKRSQATIEKIIKSKTGNSFANSGSFKIGQKPWNKGRVYTAIRGENHFNWRGGVSGITKQIRHSIEYNIWRKAVYARDRWTCQHCKVKQKFPVAHHIKTFRDYPELRFDVDNGLTLCRACHKRVHAEIGYKSRFTKQLLTN